jgi:RNA polymerase sigma-70 factor (ECF subfamily)
MWRKEKNKQKKFTSWVHLHHKALYKHALWMTGSSDTAADTVQETYHNAWLAINQLRDDKQVLAWLLTILKRSVYREFRQKYRWKTFIQELNPDDHSTTTNNDIEDTMIDTLKIMELLSASQRETFLLYALHGFTYQEISQQLKLPIGTVTSRISRAREAIQKALKQSTDNVIPLTRIHSTY